MKHLKLILLIALTLYSLSALTETTPKPPVDWVDPYIGTGGHGHVFLGASVPFGMVQLGATNISEGWDWSSGYHISDSTIFGFTHTHLSGTGIGDLCDVSIMPVTGNVKLNKGNASDPNSGLYSCFDRKTETARAGYYAVHLDRYNIGVELTATKRVGFHHYRFPPASDARVIIDLQSKLNWDKPVDTFLSFDSDTTLSGYRFSKGWASDQRIYFTITFSRPVRQLILSKGDSICAGTQLRCKSDSGRGVFGQAVFDAPTDAERDLYVKVALSPVSIKSAGLNMQKELPGWDFQQTVQDARSAWNNELSKIRITVADTVVNRIFYTALYHTMIAPSLFCDVNGDYRGADHKIHRQALFVNYTTFSLWDTYRAAHPLMTIIHPEKIGDMIRSILAIYREQGKLPVWHLMGCETDCMVGNPAIPVVADAILKGFDDFNVVAAYEAMKKSAMLNERGLKFLKQYGYIPYDLEPEALSKCLEYAIADAALSKVARRLNYKKDYYYFRDRSQSYQIYFDSKTRFMRGFSSDASFRTPFNPFESVHRDNDYVEGNAWQYTWLVPHDVNGLIELFGGRENFVEKLDSLFIVEGFLGKDASPDISGLIGQYAHGNEPSHHIPYLYAFAGQPWKTAEKVRRILTTLYSDRPDGLPGNEDAGQMSAWYILSALGFYQVDPGRPTYTFGSPLIDGAEIDTGNGRTFRITVKNNSPENCYINSVLLNGKPYYKYYIDFKQIAEGGTLTFIMSNRPRTGKKTS
jgi:predicted alpha-1,2-mannosidase